jgi:O-antigen/teichoic acid export membrane protein
MELRLAPLLSFAAFLRGVSGLAFSLLAIRIVGVDHFGYFSLIWAFCTAFLFMYTGINTVLVVRMVESRSTDVYREWMAAGLTLTVLLIIVLVGVATVFFVVAPVSSEPNLVLRFCPMMLACLIATMYSCAVLEGRGLIARATLLPLVGNFFIVTLLVISLLLNVLVTDLYSLLRVVVVAYAVEAFIAVVVCLRCVGFGSVLWRVETMKKLIVGGFSTQAANLVSFLLDPWSKSVLALNIGPAAVAIFDLAMKVGWGLSFVFSAYSRLFLQIPAADHRRRIAALTQAAELTWTPLVLIGSIVVSVLPPLLSGWLKMDPLLLAQGMVIAVAACMLMSCVSAAYISLIGFQDHAFIFRNQMIVGLANVVAAPLLVPFIGFTGAFVGSLIGTLVNVWLISRRLRYHMPEFSGLASLAQSFVGRLAVATAVFAVACIGSVCKTPAAYTVTLACAAILLLIREPLARMTWSKIIEKKGS